MPRARTDAAPRTEVLSTRALNRALLGRQMLLERHEGSATETLEHLVGMQGQVPLDPYLGLWTRLKDYDPAELAALVSDRKVVRAPLMRVTIHMVTARDFVRLRPLLQSLHEARFRSSPFVRHLDGIDTDEVATAGRELVEEAPRTRAELSRLLAERWPDRDSLSLAYVLTHLVPLVQVPPRGVWRESGQATWTTAESWLGRPIEAEPAAGEMVTRYLAAFGPASVMDFQNWSGLTRMGEVIEPMRSRLRTYRDERGTELLDVPDAPLPDPDTPAPVRFLPNYDNVLLGHADRTRVVPDEPRAPMFPGYGSNLGSLLVDGFFRGLWKVEREKGSATLLVEVTKRLSKRDAAAVSAEGMRMLEFTHADAESRDVRITCRAERN
jgi:Winged helix DNA-binding domain